MEYKIELPKEIEDVYVEAAKHSGISTEEMLQQALICYIGTCLN